MEAVLSEWRELKTAFLKAFRTMEFRSYERNRKHGNTGVGTVRSLTPVSHATSL